MKNRAKIYVIHENEEWVVPLRKSFDALDLPYEEWFINKGKVDLSEVPPQGVFYNRMSASSHTRDHRYAVELTEHIVAWLEAHGRRVINNRRAIQLEVRKLEQYIELNKLGIRTPRTIAATGREEILAAAKEIGSMPFILKPNRGGKGTGVQLIRKIETLKTILETDQENFSLDGIYLIQEYIEPKEPYIVRMEFIGGKFFYAVNVDTSEGFDLCPADDCQVGDAFCPTDSSEDGENEKAKFEIIENYEDPEIEKYERFLRNNGMEIAAIEYIEAQDGQRYVYDVNINTNYNSQAELNQKNGSRGMRRIAEFLGKELNKINSLSSQRHSLFRSPAKLRA